MHQQFVTQSPVHDHLQQLLYGAALQPTWTSRDNIVHEVEIGTDLSTVTPLDVVDVTAAEEPPQPLPPVAGSNLLLRALLGASSPPPPPQQQQPQQ